MKASPKIDPRVLLVGTLGILYLLNLLSAYALGYPFLYCWAANPIAALYLQVGQLVFFICAGWVVWNLYKGRMVQVLIACGIFAAVIELPRFAAVVLKVHGSCG